MKQYIGDSVYCEYIPKASMWKLYTSNGEADENIVILEPQVAVNLMTFLAIGLTNMGVGCDFTPLPEREEYNDQ